MTTNNTSWPNATKEELHQASLGNLCPTCKGTDVKNVGSVPDGMTMNYAYDCQNKECNAKWEGY